MLHLKSPQLLNTLYIKNSHQHWDYNCIFICLSIIILQFALKKFSKKCSLIVVEEIEKKIISNIIIFYQKFMELMF